MVKQPDSKSLPAVFQTLIWARKHGFKPVPLNYMMKSATSNTYTDPTYSPPPDDLWRGFNYGIGIATGPKSNGPADVDLDCDEAIFFASRFLPVTPAVFGRSSKKQSHYLYKTEEAEMAYQSFKDPLTKETIVEIRADGGHQTVMPGSIHQDTHEEVTWDKFPMPDVAKVKVATLTLAVRKIAMATLIARHMWLDGMRNEVCKHLSGLLYYLDWPEADVTALIVTVMEFIGDKDKSRIPTIKLTYSRAARGGKVTGRTALKKFLQNDSVVNRLSEWAGSPTASLMEEYNERFATVNYEGKFRIADFNVPSGDIPKFLIKGDFLDIMGVDMTTLEVEGKEKSVSKAKLWLANPQRRSYDGVDFLPGGDKEGVLNLWTGWAVEPADSDAGCEGWHDLLRNIICGSSDELYVWMLNWFANIIRDPMNKSMTAPVIIGVPGAGKSLTLEYFGRILGSTYTVISNEEQLYGKFNHHLSHTLLLHSEESFYGGDKKHRGIIKSMITDPFRMHESKGIDAKRVRNHVRLVFTSNEVHAAPVESGDRRYTVIYMNERKGNEALFEQVRRELRAAGPAALNRSLLNMNYDPEVSRKNIKNDDHFDATMVNFDMIQEWWYETLCNGILLPAFLDWAMLPSPTGWSQTVSSTALYVSMTLKHQGRSRPPPEGLFNSKLSEMCKIKFVKSQRIYANPFSTGDDEVFIPNPVKIMSDRQQSIRNMPTLEECRKAFERYTGSTITWPEVELPAKKSKKSNHPEY